MFAGTDSHKTTKHIPAGNLSTSTFPQSAIFKQTNSLHSRGIAAMFFTSFQPVLTELESASPGWCSLQDFINCLSLRSASSHACSAYLAAIFWDRKWSIWTLLTCAWQLLCNIQPTLPKQVMVTKESEPMWIPMSPTNYPKLGMFKWTTKGTKWRSNCAKWSKKWEIKWNLSILFQDSLASHHLDHRVSWQFPGQQFRQKPLSNKNPAVPQHSAAK